MDRLQTTVTRNTIWNELPEDTFRQHLVALEARTNAVPLRPTVFARTSSRICEAGQLCSLSIQDEQILANDLAYLAAIGEGAQSVAAVCLEEHHSPTHLCVRLAAADSAGLQLKEGLGKIGHILTSSTKLKHGGESNLFDLLATIVALHVQKLLGRLRSGKWQKPKYLSRTHKKLLWEDFDNLIHRVQHVYVKQKNPVRAIVQDHLRQLRSILKNFEDFGDDTETSLAQIVTSCYCFCQAVEIRDFAMKLEKMTKPTPQVSAALKTLHQVEKIGAYYRIALGLMRIARTYSDLFQEIRFEYLEPYKPIATDIGYEKWAKTLHVHAEVQLVIHCDQVARAAEQHKCSPARIIGTSKYLCYLCLLFLKHHGRFAPENTHGRLYDQWTIPDLHTYSEEDRLRYSIVIRKMDEEIVALTNAITPREGKRDAWRAEPMTSRQDLLGLLDSVDDQFLTQSETRIEAQEHPNRS